MERQRRRHVLGVFGFFDVLRRRNNATNLLKRMKVRVVVSNDHREDSQ
jgi:hypothetical protein